MEAAKRNYLLLKNKYNGNLAAAIKGQSDSPVDIGSEFRSTTVLKTIFRRHPIWHRMQDILRHGLDWPLDTLSKQQQITDNATALTYGNHKGAQGNLPLLLNLIEKDVRFGYAVTFLLARAHLTPGVVIAPMNIRPDEYYASTDN